MQSLHLVNGGMSRVFLQREHWFSFIIWGLEAAEMHGSGGGQGGLSSGDVDLFLAPADVGIPLFLDPVILGRLISPVIFCKRAR